MISDSVEYRYAAAYLEAAIENGALGRAEDDMKTLRSCLERDPTVFKVFERLDTMLESRLEVIENAFGPDMHPLTIGLLKTLLNHDRFGLVFSLPEGFWELLDERENVIEAQVVSARCLSESVRKELVDRLERRTGRRVKATFLENPGLGAGFTIRYDGRLMDHSAQGAFSRLRDKVVD